MEGKLVPRQSPSMQVDALRTIKRVKTPLKRCIFTRVEIINFTGINALCRLGGMATHGSSSIKIKAIGNYPKFKIRGRALIRLRGRHEGWRDFCSYCFCQFVSSTKLYKASAGHPPNSSVLIQKQVCTSLSWTRCVCFISHKKREGNKMPLLLCQS